MAGFNHPARIAAVRMASPKASKCESLMNLLIWLVGSSNSLFLLVIDRIMIKIRLLLGCVEIETAMNDGCFFGVDFLLVSFVLFVCV